MSAVQINLLPEAKADFVKGQANQARWLKLTVLVAGVLAALFIIVAGLVYGLQRHQLSSAAKNLASAQAQLQQVPDLNKMLTVKNQLNTLIGLHDQKHAAGRLFGFLSKVTPAKATISSLAIDFKTSAMTLSGNADSLSTVNALIDTLKLAQMKSDNNPTPQAAFPSVVESSFGSSGGNTNYSLNIKFAPSLFDNRLSGVSLVFPSQYNPNSFQNSDSLFKSPGQ